MADPFVPLDDLVSRIPDGALLALPKDSSGVAMAATRALIRRGVRDLHIVCVPVSGLQADMLIGAGCVATVQCGGVNMDEFGLAPRFREAVQQGAIRMVDSTCPAIYAALQAGEKGNPFVPLRGLIGSDVQRYRNDWVIIDNPFSETKDPIVLLPAIRPDVALFHVRLADANGNVWVGNRRELITVAHAARCTLVTAEEIYDGDLITDERLVAGTIPALYVDAVAHAPKGAWPLALTGRYRRDAEVLRGYVAAAKTQAGFDAWLVRHLDAETVAA